MSHSPLKGALVENRSKIIAISGVSGVGKSTISSNLSKILNCTHINQDSYYLKEKPLVTLSDKRTVKNWDDVDALDFVKLRNDINTHRILGNPVFSPSFSPSFLPSFCSQKDQNTKRREERQDKRQNKIQIKK